MDQPAEAVRAIYAAFRRGDIEGVLARLDPDVLWDHNWQRDPPEARRPRRGREAVRGFFRHLGAVEFLRFEPQGFLSGGSMVAVPVEVEMRSRAHGGVLRDLEIHLWTFGRDRLATHHRAFVDSHALAAFERG